MRPYRLVGLLLVAPLLSGSLSARPFAPPASFAQDDGCVVVEDFSGDRVGAFPAKWKAKEEEGLAVYRVMEEGGLRFLRATARGLGVPAGLQVDGWDLATHPVLAWMWRPLEFPRGADERERGRNDSALGVYAVFPNPVGVRSLKYVWSGVAPPNTEFTASLRMTQGRVLRAGPAEPGRWYEERVNVLEDARRRFGGDAAKPAGIGVLTDADDTRSSAAGDYARFRICRDAGSPRRAG